MKVVLYHSLCFFLIHKCWCKNLMYMHLSDPYLVLRFPIDGLHAKGYMHPTLVQQMSGQFTRSVHADPTVLKGPSGTF